MSDRAPTVFDAITPGSDPIGYEDLQSVWAAYASKRAAGASPFVAAVGVATHADRLGHAFAVGYPAALERLVPGIALPPALCVTEDGGNHPRAVMTTLEPARGGYRLDGTKSFVTFGSLAKELVVAARAGTRKDGRPEIAVVQIPASRTGVHVEELPPTPFVPEVRHARLRLEAVEVREDEKLPGDGYLGYVKPFRTIEDIHVVGATVGYAFGLAARAGGSAELMASLSHDLAALSALQDAEPLDPRVHLALHACYTRVRAALESADFGTVLNAASARERSRWERDKALLSIAQQARDARFETAKRSLGLHAG